MTSVHSQYGYSPTEQFYMFLLTGVTNFAGIPVLIQFWKKKMYYQSMIAVLVLSTSFMYHSMDSMDIDRMFLTATEWHRIDNIGAIGSFSMVCVYLMDNQNPNLDIKLNLIGLFATLLFQERAPWVLGYTLYPIAIYLAMWLMIGCVTRKRKAKYNKKMLVRGWGFMFLAVIAFIKGLDEYGDYLRFYHGMWHFIAGIASFYMWQSTTDSGDEFTWTNLFTKPVTVTKYSLVTL